MAYALATGDIVQVNINYAQVGVVEMMNTLHYRVSTGVPIPDGRAAILELITAIGNTGLTTSFASRWAQLASSAVVIDRLTGQRVYPVRYGLVTLDVHIPGAQDPEEPVPPPIQLAITKRGDLATRYSVGGIRVPGLSTGFEVDGKLAGGGQLNADNLASVLDDVLTTAGGTIEWIPIVYRRSNPGSSVQVVAAQAHNVLRTQRTRIPGKGV